MQSKFNAEYGLITRRIVRQLSYNSRTTVSELAEQLHMSRSTVAGRLRRMESGLRMGYTLEFNHAKLGLENPHIILVRFHKKPDYLDVARTLSQYYIAQFAATIEGSYDLLIYANAYSLAEYLTWDMRMRALLMKKYKMEWSTSTVSFNRMGYLPVRDEALDKSNIPPRYREMLKILNLNSRMPINQLARLLKMNYKTTVYTFNSLMKLGYIRRFTVNLGIHDKISLMTMFNRFIPTLDYKGVEEVSREFFGADDRMPLVSRFLLASNTVGAYDFFDMAAYDDFKTGYKYGIELYNRVYKDYDITETEYGQVKDVLLGRLPIRSVEAAKDFKHFHIPEAFHGLQVHSVR